MLEEFKDQWETDLEGMRSLGYFKLRVKNLLKRHFKTINEADFELQIMGSVEYLLDFLDLELCVLDTKTKFPSASAVANYLEPVMNPQITNTSEFTWTDNKTHLIEIIESILHLRSINNGRVVKSDFMRHIGSALNIDLKNHSSLLNDILNRYDDLDTQNARIYYIKNMSDALSDKLENLDKNRRNR